MANHANTEMFIIVHNIKEKIQVINYIKEEVDLDQLYPDNEIDETYPLQIELSFITIWGLPKELLKELTIKFPNISWNCTTSESSHSYKGLAVYYSKEENLLEPPQMQINESHLRIWKNNYL